MNETITLPELERAINYWRSRSPAEGDELRLCREAAALATPYALMIVARRREISRSELGPDAAAAWDAYRSAS